MKNILFSALAALTAVSCMKDVAPDANLVVVPSKDKYEAGEPVTFKFTGDPDNIVFYSGEDGHRYENKHRTEGDCDIYVDFKTFVRSNNAGVYDNLRFLVSTDFSGVYSPENVEAATWIDLTDNFRLSHGNDNYPSGEMKLNEYVGAGKFFIAFKYVGKGNQWIVRTADVSQVTPEGIRNSIGSISKMGWTAVDCGNPGVGIDTKNLNRLYFDGNASGNGEDNCDWVISKPLDAKGLVPDTGVAIKNLSTTMSEFTYTYEKPGTYNAVFETSSVWYDDSKYSRTEVEVHVAGEPYMEPVPVLNIASGKSEYAAGEAAVFTLSGSGVSNITLWTGDEGHDWAERDNYVRKANGNLAVVFTTKLDWFKGESPASDNLRFLVSKDFDGIYDAQNISAATWTDLSEYCIFAKEGQDHISSGELLLNNYVSGDEPVYMAFRYTNETAWANRWVVRSIRVDAITPAGVRNSVANMASMDWKLMDLKGTDKWTASGQLLLASKLGVENEDWAISKAFDRGSVSIGPDTGVAAELGTKTYVFKVAGTYTVVADYFDGKAWKQSFVSVTVK